jgi:hypothetical protein
MNQFLKSPSPSPPRCQTCHAIMYKTHGILLTEKSWKLLLHRHTHCLLRRSTHKKCNGFSTSITQGSFKFSSSSGKLASALFIGVVSGVGKGACGDFDRNDVLGEDDTMDTDHSSMRLSRGCNRLGVAGTVLWTI